MEINKNEKICNNLHMISTQYSLRSRSIKQNDDQDRKRYQQKSIPTTNHHATGSVCTRHSLRSKVDGKNHQSFDDRTSNSKEKYSLKFNNEDNTKPRDLKNHTNKLPKKNTTKGSMKDESVNQSEAGNSDSGYSLRSSTVAGTNNRSLDSNVLTDDDSLRFKEKGQCSYMLRDRIQKKSENVSTENTSNSRIVSNKINCRKNAVITTNTRTKNCENEEIPQVKIKRRDKLQEKKKVLHTKHQKPATEITNILTSGLRTSSEIKRPSVNDNEIENESFNDKVLVSYKTFPKSKTIRTNVGKKPKIAFDRSYSFEKYGVIPSYEKVLDNISKIRKEANALDAYEEKYGNLDNSLPLNLQNNNSIELHEEQNLLDCTHLSEEKLQEYFRENIEYTGDILNGKLTSRRHERYKSYDPKTHLTMDDLTYSPSIVVFASNQRDFLLKLLEDHFDPDGEKTDYFFKVLLPELCLKIFMDVYEMTVDCAQDYLNWRPLD